MKKQPSESGDLDDCDCSEMASLNADRYQWMHDQRFPDKKLLKGAYMYFYKDGEVKVFMSLGNRPKVREFPCQPHDVIVVRYCVDEKSPGAIVVQLLDENGFYFKSYLVENGDWQPFPVASFDKIRVYHSTEDEPTSDSEVSEFDEDDDDEYSASEEAALLKSDDSRLGVGVDCGCI